MSRVSAIFYRLLGTATFVAGAGFAVGIIQGRPDEFPSTRSRAYCEFERGRLTIAVSPTLCVDTTTRIEAVLRHEFGHALLFFWGHNDHTEREADQIAEQVFGDPIYYDEALVQSLQERGGTRPRPRSLG